MPVGSHFNHYLVVSYVMSTISANQRRLYRELLQHEPRSAEGLHRFVGRLLKLSVPREAIVPGHAAPFDYLCHSFFDRGDCIVWASRGGGKTMLAAAATLLDLIFKPGISLCIMAGSLEQSRRMFGYLLDLLETPYFMPLLAVKPTRQSVRLINGSRVELLAGSQRSVRGRRVQKLRCDELDDIDPDLWKAAQLTIRSARCGRHVVAGGIEAISTMHNVGGLMDTLWPADGNASATTTAPAFKWCALDVIERCSADRPCGGCALWEDCQGRAKVAGGFVPVDDLITARRRSSNALWRNEMMCERPALEQLVYPDFDTSRHVVQSSAETERSAGDARNEGEAALIIAGMDFGLRSPLVMLWARVVGEAEESPMDHRVEVFAEYVAEGLTLDQNLPRIEARGLPRPTWLGVDPAGAQRNSHSGLSDIQVLRRRGYRVRAASELIRPGIERIRRRLDRGTLQISADCTQLIAAISRYRFDAKHLRNETPVKDGPDHLCDALRYLLRNLELVDQQVRVGRW